MLVTEQKVKKKLMNLNTDKSQGPDGINPRLLKECNSSLPKPLSIIYQKSVDTGISPSDFKTANIIPIFKKGFHSSTGNYRPVSITSAPLNIRVNY